MSENSIPYYIKVDDYGNANISRDKIFAIPKDSTLVIELINGCPISKNIKLISNCEENFPDEYYLENTVFDINKSEYSKYIFEPDYKNSMIIFKLNMKNTGAIKIFFSYLDNNNQNKLTNVINLIVEPEIIINEKKIEMNSISLISVLSKNIGKLTDFKEFYKECNLLNYNFIHYTPIQKYGNSNSLYCLANINEINDSFFSEKLDNNTKLEYLDKEIKENEKNFSIGSIVDIVLNHTSDNSDWIADHPECGYNLENSPWLNCAYDLDKTLADFSKDFIECKTKLKFQPFINNENDLNITMGEIDKIIKQRNLYEYFNIDLEKNLKKYEEIFDDYKKDNNKYKINKYYTKNEDDYFYNNCIDKLGEERNGVEIIEQNLLNLLLDNKIEKETFLKKLKSLILNFNSKWQQNSNNMLNSALGNIRKEIHENYLENINPYGHKAIKYVHELCKPFFIPFGKEKNKIFANNGWISNSDDPHNPNPDFTLKNTYYYYKRNINIWCDCVKINYGKNLKTCPKYLLDFMTKYVTDMAKIFKGFRLDNAHSTPEYIGEYLMMKAREVNPNLLVIAELFTSPEIEINFMNKLGINLYIRELCWFNDINSMSGRMYFCFEGEQKKFGMVQNEDKKYKYLYPKRPESIIYDITHDNETFYKKYNNLGVSLTVMACNSFSICPIGSTRGTDQLFPKQPSVVNENRNYLYVNEEIEKNINEIENDKNNNNEKEEEEEKEEKKEEIEKIKKVNFEFKCDAEKVFLALSSRGWKPNIELKKKENGLFSIELELDTSETHYYKYVINNKDWVYDKSKPFVNDGSGNINNYIEFGPKKDKKNEVEDFNKLMKSCNFHKFNDLTIFRHYLNYMRKEFYNKNIEYDYKINGNYISIFRNVQINGDYLQNENDSFFYGYGIICRTGYNLNNNYQKYSIGLPGEFCELVCAVFMKNGKVNVEEFDKNNLLENSKNLNEVYITKNEKILKKICKFNNEKNYIEFNPLIHSNFAILIKYKIPENKFILFKGIYNNLYKINNEYSEYTKDLNFSDINLMLFKCEKEELENTKGKRGNYNIQGFGKFVYAGLYHLNLILYYIKLYKDNYHPILNNVRSGDWLIQYVFERLSNQNNIKKIYDTLNDIYKSYTQLPSEYKPNIFINIINTLYSIVIKKIYEITKNDLFKNKENIILKNILISIFSFTGNINSSKLNEDDLFTLSAGLPNFSTDFFRCWGRDTFISLKGLFLIPGYFSEAKHILKQFSSVLRHGLIPNLLGNGTICRYNSRDAVWFYLKSLLDYLEFSNDYEFLKEKIEMKFKSNDLEENEKLKDEKKLMSIEEIIYDILNNHLNDIKFTEWNAGKKIDSQMEEEGFEIEIKFNEKNGFIYGGNEHNCGTWMDKMGSSVKAKNKGIPATARNGADVEIISLLYYCLNKINDLIKENKISLNELKLKDKTFTIEEWKNLIENNFEKEFFVENKNELNKYDNFYKDYVSEKEDDIKQYDLRCNVFIAMSIAPELFNKEHAKKFLDLCEKNLFVFNSLGIRTLDKNNKNYNGNYNPENDSNDFNSALGFNYHNGPEWVWVNNCYFMSLLNFFDKEEVKEKLDKYLFVFYRHIINCEWGGLPELTNQNGNQCKSGSFTQAWSVATFIEVLDKLNKI